MVVLWRTVFIMTWRTLVVKVAMPTRALLVPIAHQAAAAVQPGFPLLEVMAAMAPTSPLGLQVWLVLATSLLAEVAKVLTRIS